MATRNPTLTPEALKEIIDQAVKEALAAREIQENSKAKADTRSKIVTAFVKVDPSKPLSAQTDVNVLTYWKWELDMGAKVKTGHLRIKGYHVPLFHLDQTEVMSRLSARNISLDNRQRPPSVRRKRQLKLKPQPNERRWP